MGGLLAFMALLLLLAAALRVDFYFYLLYLCLGIILLGRWWAQRAMLAVAYERRHPERVFWGERPEVQLLVHNRGWLPVLWLHVHDSFPVELRSPNFFQQVLSLMPRERVTLRYELECRHRGYYPLGPLALESGDLLGSKRLALAYRAPDTLVVYPRIIPLPDLSFPSRSLFGSLPSRQRIFEDPTRIMGTRDYVPGDSLRHIAWKTSAALGCLRTKRYQPAIALDTTIFLNLNRADYSQRRQYQGSELAIVVAASVASALVERRQAVGFGTTGMDPLALAAGDAEGQGAQASGAPSTLKPATGGGACPPTMPPRKGRPALMQILDLLARVQAGDGPDFPSFLQRETSRLAWGCTLVLVTGRVDDALFAAMAYLRRSGFSVVLVTVDSGASFSLVRARAGRIGVPAFEVWEEEDLERWGLGNRREAS